MGEGIIVQSKWLQKIAPLYIVVFAAGARLGKHVRMCAISQANDVHDSVVVPIDGKSKKLGIFEGKFVVRRKGLEDLLVAVPFVLVHDKKRYLVQDFEEYMSKNWAKLTKENDNVRTA